MDIAKQLLLQAFLIFLNAFFAMTEIAVISLKPSKLRKQAEEGDRAASRLLKLVEEPSGFLSTIQVGITLAGFLGSAFAADSFSEYLVDWVYNGVGFRGLSVAALDTLAVIVITIILSYFTLVFGELVPKRIAMQKPMEVARISSTVVAGLSVGMRPVIRFLSFSTNSVLRLLRMKTEGEDETVSEDEIRMMVDLGEEKGTIESEAGEWIDNVFEFSDTTVREVMTHAKQVVSVSAEDSAAEILDVIRRTGRTRMPMVGRDQDDILGVLNSRAFLLEQQEEHPRPARELLTPAHFVPETLRATALFRDMQRKKQHMAIVIDEYGGAVGVVTMEDLLEEIVGNIYDEFDPAEEKPIRRVAEDCWRVAGSVRLDELSEATGFRIPEDIEVETLNGLVLSQLSSIPADGETLKVIAYGLEVEVLSIQRRMVREAFVRVAKPAEITEES